MAGTTLTLPPAPYTEHLAKHFGQQASLYHQQSGLQAGIAQCFALWLHPRILPSLQGYSVVEIGCGTGHLTRFLPSLLGTGDILATDIAAGMLAEHQEQLPPEKWPLLKQTLWDANTDLGNLPKATMPIHTITGSMCLHWLNDWPTTIQHWQQKAQQLAFAIPTQGSLADWQTLCDKENIPYRGPIYPTEAELLRVFSNAAGASWQVNLETETFSQTHSSAWAFVKHLKAIGAHTPQPNTHSGWLRQLAQEHRNQTAQPYTETYRVTFIHAVPQGQQP